MKRLSSSRGRRPIRVSSRLTLRRHLLDPARGKLSVIALSAKCSAGRWQKQVRWPMIRRGNSTSAGIEFRRVECRSRRLVRSLSGSKNRRSQLLIVARERANLTWIDASTTGTFVLVALVLFIGANVVVNTWRAHWAKFATDMAKAARVREQCDEIDREYDKRLYADIAAQREDDPNADNEPSFAGVKSSLDQFDPGGTEQVWIKIVSDKMLDEDGTWIKVNDPSPSVKLCKGWLETERALAPVVPDGYHVVAVGKPVAIKEPMPPLTNGARELILD
jgi:hypothetical protein